MDIGMVVQEFGFDCKIRKLSPKTIVNYQKQLVYLQRFLEDKHNITTIEAVRSTHIKQFLVMMDLFVSYARGESTPDSDVDLRIDKGEVRGMQMAFLLSDLEDALKLPVDLLSTAALDARFLQSIKDEEKLVYERI